MTESQERATRTAAWADAVTEALMPVIDSSVKVVTGASLEDGDVAGAEKLARAAGVIARSARAIVTLDRAPPRGGRDVEAEEDEMKRRDDSPETLERLRAELEARIDRLDAVLEAKGIVVEPGCWPTARPERQPVHAP